MQKPMWLEKKDGMLYHVDQVFTIRRQTLNYVHSTLILLKGKTFWLVRSKNLIRKLLQECLRICKHCFNSVISSKTINLVHEVETNLSDENSDEGRVIEYIDLAEELREEPKWT